MLASLVALLLDAGATAPPGDQPLRTVVYRVSVQQRDEESMERYRGLTTPRGLSVDQGTVTIDVMSRAGDSLAIRATEQMHGRGYPAIFLGSVAPDGAVRFADETISDATYDLLRYFGVRFAAGHSLDPGESWKTVGGDFVVKSSTAPLVMLESLERYRVPNSIATLAVHGSVFYDPGLLVPVRGTIERRQTEIHPEGSIDVIETSTFERTSDTFDLPTPR